MRRWQVLLVLGLVGVASLLLVPIERLVPMRLPVPAVRLLATVQPAILTALAVWLGEAAAQRVGLHAPLVDAWLGGRGSPAVLRRQLPPALAAGLVSALVVVLYTLTIGRDLASGSGSQARLAGFDLPLVTKLLYGGLTEEVLTRWGLLSILAWAGWRLTGRRSEPSVAIFAVAVGMAALLFAAGHLPTLFLIAPNASAGLVLAVLAGNTVPGLLFGALYVRHGLEAAMMAHLTAHLLAAMVLVAV